jgi:DNA repair exonuclease SbcCD ATPase subunit
MRDEKLAIILELRQRVKALETERTGMLKTKHDQLAFAKRCMEEMSDKLKIAHARIKELEQEMQSLDDLLKSHGLDY